MAFPYEEAGIAESTEEEASVQPDMNEPEPTEEVSTETETEGEANSGESAQEDDFDFDQYGDREVTIVVDGEEQRVPLKELKNGYMRQADYTRKTQEVAAQRQQAEAFAALQQALQERPADVIRSLQERFGMTHAQATEAYNNAEEQGEVDPQVAGLQQQVQQLSAWQQAEQQRREDAALAAEIERLQGKYGEDFKPLEVIQKAADMGIQSVNQLEGVHKMLAFDSVSARLQATQEFTASEAAAEAQRQAAAAEASASTSSSSGSQLNPTVPKTYSSIDEAFADSERELGFSWD